MKDLPTELVYGLGFAAIVLFQYVMKRFGQRNSGQHEGLAQTPDEVKVTPAITSVSSVSVGQFGRGELPSAPSPLAMRRFGRASLLGTRREVQNAIVIATILGPCRAFEPHAVR